MVRLCGAERLRPHVQPRDGLSCSLIKFDEACAGIAFGAFTANPQAPRFESDIAKLQPLNLDSA